MKLEGYRSWDHFLSSVCAGCLVYYHAPFDASAHIVRIERIFKNGKVRIDPMTNQADKFTADVGHLSRFFLRLAPPCADPMGCLCAG